VRIAIDIDSTLHHYWDQFSAAARRRFGVDLPYEHQVTWNVSLLRSEQLRACVEETHRDENVLAAEPYPGAVEVVSRWHRAGHFILVTSHRAAESNEATARWLDAIGLPYDLLHCSHDKVPHCVEHEVDLLIDDAPANLESALDAGISVATIVHPWNADFCETERVVCARDWAALDAALAPLLDAAPIEREGAAGQPAEGRQGHGSTGA
jgi:uncharacterized HAD superfamily protein